MGWSHGEGGEQSPDEALRGEERVDAADADAPQLEADHDAPTQQDKGGGVNERVGVVAGQQETECKRCLGGAVKQIAE